MNGMVHSIFKIFCILSNVSIMEFIKLLSGTSKLQFQVFFRQQLYHHYVQYLNSLKDFDKLCVTNVDMQFPWKLFTISFIQNQDIWRNFYFEDGITYVGENLDISAVAITPTNDANWQLFSDSNNILLRHESEDIKEKSLFPKFQLFPILRVQIMHDYVCFNAPIDYCVESSPRVRDFLWKLLSFHI